jgi:hypothetical protein
MNPTFLLASIAAAIIGSAQAGYIYIYSPYAATKCQPGTPCAIAWHVAHDGPEFERVDIELLVGEAHNARVVAPIALGYDLNQGNTFLWNVPQGSLPDGNYFIRIKGVGTDYQSYSHNFPIGFGPHPIPTIVPTVTPTATSTPTGSSTEVVTPTRTGSALSSISSAKKSSTATASTSTSSAMSVQGSVSVAAAVVAAAFAIMMF